MVTDIALVDEVSARRWIFVVADGACVTQALAGSLNHHISRSGDGRCLVHFGGGVADFASQATAEVCLRGLLDARRADGAIVTEQRPGESAADFRDRHVAALLEAGVIRG